MRAEAGLWWKGNPELDASRAAKQKGRWIRTAPEGDLPGGLASRACSNPSLSFLL